jgi:hypothetical protein
MVPGRSVPGVLEPIERGQACHSRISEQVLYLGHSSRSGHFQTVVLVFGTEIFFGIDEKGYIPNPSLKGNWNTLT